MCTTESCVDFYVDAPAAPCWPVRRVGQTCTNRNPFLLHTSFTIASNLIEHQIISFIRKTMTVSNKNRGEAEEKKQEEVETPEPGTPWVEGT